MEVAIYLATDEMPSSKEFGLKEASLSSSSSRPSVTEEVLNLAKPAELPRLHSGGQAGLWPETAQNYGCSARLVWLSG